METIKDLLTDYIEVVSIRDRKGNVIDNLTPQEAVEKYPQEVLWYDIVPYGLLTYCLKVML